MTPVTTAQADAMMDAAEEALATLYAASTRTKTDATADEAFALVATAIGYLTGLAVGRFHSYPADIDGIANSITQIAATASFAAGNEAGKHSQRIANRRTRRRRAK
jgi:hypothetical protein